ncbi:MAG: oligosaccharide flippase family protein [Patescibacteria group bacterium]
MDIGGMQRRLEGYIKTDSTYLFGSGFWLVLAKVLGVLASFALGIAFANLLEKELYGNYKYIISLAAIISTLSLTGVGTALTRAAARGFDGELEHSYRLTFYSSLIGSFVAICASVYYFLNANELLGWSFAIIALCTPFSNVSSLFRSYLTGKKQFRVQALGTTLQGVIPALLIIAALFFSNSVILFIAILLVTTACIGLIFEWYAKSKFHTNSERDPEATRLAIHSSILNFLGALASRTDAILVFQNMGGTALAVYAFATAMPDTLRGSLKIITSLAVPKFAVKAADEVRRAVLDKTIPVTIGMAVVTIAYIVAAPYLFALFFPTYIESLVYSQVYALTILLSAVLAAAYFDSQLAIRERYILGIVSAVTQIGLALIGLLFFGLWGVIAARIAARILLVSLSMYLIIRR